MKRTATPQNNSQVIRFQDDHFLLTREYLLAQKHAFGHVAEIWQRPFIKFLSFHNNELTLRIAVEQSTYTLRLQVQSRQVRVGCSCGHKGKAICMHAHGALLQMEWQFNDRYLGRLHPKGIIALALAHPLYFDKEESVAGINAEARPELSTVYQLSHKPLAARLQKALSLPVIILKQQSTNSKAEPQQPITTSTAGHALAWVILLPQRKCLLPAIVPAMGTMNKAGTAIRTWLGFNKGLTKQVVNSLPAKERQIFTDALALFKQVELQDGRIISKDKDEQQTTAALATIFQKWFRLWPLIINRQLLYGYSYYGSWSLKRKPHRRYIAPLVLAPGHPVLSFLLTDHGPFYKLKLQFTVGDCLLEDPDTEVSFMIASETRLYMLASLRDAALVEWMHDCDDCLSIFKEHAASFFKEILKPLRRCYRVQELRAPDKNESST